MFPVWAHTVKCLCPIFSSAWVGPASLHHRSVWPECGLGAPLDILSCDQGAVTDWGSTSLQDIHTSLSCSGCLSVA